MADLNNIVGKELTLKEKVKTAFSSQVFKKFEEKADHLILHEGKSQLAANFSVMKYTTILFTVGTIVGGVIGWIQGGKFDNWRDVAKHPLKATAVVFGFKSAEQFRKEIGKDTEVKVAMPSEHSAPASAPSDKWQEHVKSCASFSESVAQEKVQQASAASLG